MKFFNTEVLDVKIPNNDELLNLIKYLSKYNIDIDSLLYFSPTTNYLNLLKLNLTKEQKVLITYRKIFTRNYEEIEVAAKAGYISYEELLTVIYLLKDNYYNEQSFLYKCILLHTDFKPDKKVFDYINEELIFQMTEIQEIINTQWKKGNKDVLFFCDKIYKESKPLLFFYFPVEIGPLKEYFDKKIDEGLIDKELDIICSIDINRNRRINLLKKYYSQIHKGMDYIRFDVCFNKLKEIDDSEEVEAVLVDIWVKFILLHCNVGFPEDKFIIKYKNNLAKLEALDLMDELMEIAK